ncbi:MAG: hypothetical protein ACJAV7_000348 [Flavobacteriales bacterium]|jgi:hypothetical protein
MKTRFIDPLNTFLIICAAFLAYIFPFWVFVLSYVILGPLHYLTEINWLNDRDFFFHKRTRWLWLLGAAVLISLLVLINQISPSLLPQSISAISSSNLILAAFLSAVVLLYVESKKWAYLICALVFILAIALPPLPTIFYLIAAFLPTVLHVYVFTGLFMIQGAHRNKSKIGYLNVVLLMVLGLLMLVIPPLSNDYFNETTSAFMVESRFNNLSKLIAQMIPEAGNSYGRIQSFLAFIYSYHYLNWFSKTGLIRWHESKKWKLVMSILAWIAAIVLYLINFKLGLTVLFSLSLLHVFLEFPLNIKSIGYIFGNIILKKPLRK